jgi:hypothetical protein
MNTMTLRCTSRTLIAALLAAGVTAALLATVPGDAAVRSRRPATTVRRPPTTRPPFVPLAPTTAPATTVAAPAPTTAPPTPTSAPSTTVPAVPFTLSRPVVNVALGRNASRTITEIVTYEPGFRGDLRWEVPPAFDGISVSVAPNPSRNLAEITVRTSPGTSLGSVPFPVQVTGGGVTRTYVVVVTVSEAATVADPTVAVTQQWIAGLDPVGLVPAGSSASVTLRITRINGFTGRLTGSVLAAPAGITLGLSENPIGDAATLVVNVAGTVAPGSYQVTVQLTSGTVASALVFGVIVPGVPIV